MQQAFKIGSIVKHAENTPEYEVLGYLIDRTGRIVLRRVKDTSGNLVSYATRNALRLFPIMVR